MNKEKILLEKLESYLKMDAWYEGPYLDINDIKILVGALKKQIPQKVIEIDNRLTKEFVWRCPACKNSVDYWEDKFYCCCGQALDWDDIDE